MYIQFLYIKIYNFRIKIYNFRIKSDKMIKELKKNKMNFKKKVHDSSGLMCYFFTAEVSYFSMLYFTFVALKYVFILYLDR